MPALSARVRQRMGELCDGHGQGGGTTAGILQHCDGGGATQHQDLRGHHELPGEIYSGIIGCAWVIIISICINQSQFVTRLDQAAAG